MFWESNVNFLDYSFCKYRLKMKVLLFLVFKALRSLKKPKQISFNMYSFHYKILSLFDCDQADQDIIYNTAGMHRVNGSISCAPFCYFLLDYVFLLSCIIMFFSKNSKLGDEAKSSSYYLPNCDKVTQGANLYDMFQE